jgi:hypothetical protein
MQKTAIVNMFFLLIVIGGIRAAAASESPNVDAPFAVGQWIGGVERDQHGHFIDCTAHSTAADSQSGVALAVLANANLWLTLYDSSWHFGKQPIQIRLRAGAYDLGLRTTEPPNGSVLDINLGSDRTVALALSSGENLEAFIGPDRKMFSIQDGGKAILALADCAQSRVGRPN